MNLKKRNIAWVSQKSKRALEYDTILKAKLQTTLLSNIVTRERNG